MRHTILIIALAVAGMATNPTWRHSRRSVPRRQRNPLRQYSPPHTSRMNIRFGRLPMPLPSPITQRTPKHWLRCSRPTPRSWMITATPSKGGKISNACLTKFSRNIPRGKIEISIKSIRFVTPVIAIEDGTSTVTHEANEPPERDRYMVIHVKQDGKWIMASARDLADEESSGQDQLQQLAWLIGDWVDESPDAMVVTSYRWTDNHQFILGDFTVQIGGNPAMTGSQRFGWDPLAKQIRCWVFDSQGGFAEGTWMREGNRWIVKMNGVTREGKPASSTNITTMLSKDRMTWQSRDRLIGGEKMPDIEEVPIVHKPPKPL